MRGWQPSLAQAGPDQMQSCSKAAQAGGPALAHPPGLCSEALAGRLRRRPAPCLPLLPSARRQRVPDRRPGCQPPAWAQLPGAPPGAAPPAAAAAGALRRRGWAAGRRRRGHPQLRCCPLPGLTAGLRCPGPRAPAAQARGLGWPCSDPAGRLAWRTSQAQWRRAAKDAAPRALSPPERHLPQPPLLRACPTNADAWVRKRGQR